MGHPVDVSSVIRRYLSRPAFLIVVLVLALLAGAFGWMRTTTTYTATAKNVVAPPRADAQGQTQNPIAGIDTDSSSLALVVASLAESSKVSDAVTAQGGTLQPVDTTVGGESAAPTFTPQVNLVVQSDDQQDAERSAATAVRLTKQALTDLQDRQGVTQENQQVQLLSVSAPQVEASSQTSRLRAAVGFALGVILLGLAATVFLGTRDARREARAADAARQDTDNRPRR